MNDVPADITLEMMRGSLFAAVVCDVLDSLGYRRQSPRTPLKPLSVETVLVGRAKTTLWCDVTQPDPAPYEMELTAVDGCEPDDVFVAAAGGSTKSGIWGELLSTAARRRGCQGALIDGSVRDLAKLREMRFPVFALGTCPYDSKDRQAVVEIDVPVQIAGVTFHPGDLVIADVDGIVVVPRDVEEQAIRRAWQKVHAEDQVRTALLQGLSAREAYRRFGVL